MDIWDWVEGTTARLREGDAESQRLARLMRELPTATCDDEHERVDMLIPEAIAVARRLGETWVELFLRHWNLQSRVLHRNLARSEDLREAVDLLEFANRPDTQKCPQSVCVTQDLACCYSRADGPGYVAERLAVADETLARIDPSWPCFDCISAEYFSALMDDMRAPDGLAFLDRQQAKLAEHGIFKLGSNLVHNRADALLAVGRPSEALAVLDGVRNPGRLGDSYAMHHRMIRVKVLLALKQPADALAQHPEFSAIVDTASHYEDWVLGLRGLIAAGEVSNDAETGERLLTLQRTLERNGSRWDAAEMAAHAAELAIERGSPGVARLHLADLARLRGLLRRPAGLDVRVGAIERDLAALGPARELPDPPTLEAIETLLRGENDEGLPHEFALDVLTAARAARPDDCGLAIHEARVLRRLGRADVARTRLERLFGQLSIQATVTHDHDGPPPIERVAVELAVSALDERDFGVFDGLLDRLRLSTSHGAAPIGAATATHLLRLQAESLQMRGDLNGAELAFRRLLEAGPGDAWLHIRLADLAQARGDWAAVLVALEPAIAELAPGEHDWQFMVAATVLGRWELVRRAIARLGLPEFDPDVDPSTPIDSDLGMVRCEFVEPDGSRNRYWTRRTSPCGGLVVELAFPQDPQHFRDRVVYEPTDIDVDRDDDHPMCFPVVAILEAPAWTSFVMRGWDPGEAEAEKLLDAFTNCGFGAERFTAPGRTGHDPSSDDPEASELPTMALLVAAPDDAPTTLDEVRRCLRSATQNWAFPLLCPELDGALGDDDARESADDLLARMRP